MASVEGSNTLKKSLDAIGEKLKSATAVEVGFIENKTYPDGQRVAAVAMTQEFGGTIRVPEHETTIYRKIDQEGDFQNNGRFVKRNKANYATTHTVEAYTIKIPPRPFFRNAIEKNSHNWGANLGTALRENNNDAETALGLLGQDIAEQIQDSIRSNIPPPNAKSTVKGKGSSQTLINSSLMLNSVSHLVK